jgi:hypothetical protein
MEPATCRAFAPDPQRAGRQDAWARSSETRGPGEPRRRRPFRTAGTAAAIVFLKARRRPQPLVLLDAKPTIRPGTDLSRGFNIYRLSRRADRPRHAADSLDGRGRSASPMTRQAFLHDAGRRSVVASAKWTPTGGPAPTHAGTCDATDCLPGLGIISPHRRAPR